MKLLSVREAADALGVSQNLIYALCAKKQIRHERHGLGRGTIRIPEDALEEYRRGVTVETRSLDFRPAAPRKFKHLT
jgi:excisionase family DNA binding protein